MTIEARLKALEQRTGAPVAVVVVPYGEDENAAIARARATWTHEPELIVLIRKLSTAAE